MNEQDLIARYFAPLAGPGGLGLRDDAALLAPPPGAEIVLTADALVAGVHFFPDDLPEDIAAKALGVNLSDLAAKAADPLGFLLTIALSPDFSHGWLEAFARGLGEAASAWRCPLLGGDTVSTPGPLTLSITAIGAVTAGRMPRRTTAAPGDTFYVSGTIGDAALGLLLRRAELGRAETPDWSAALTAEQRSFLVGRYLRPCPRLALAPAMRAASAAMDVSDGLVGDLRALSRASGVSPQADLAKIPLSEPARIVLAADPGLFDLLMCGGDDYEILCAVRPQSVQRFEALAQAAGAPVTAFGVADALATLESFAGPDGSKKSFDRDRHSHF